MTVGTLPPNPSIRGASFSISFSLTGRVSSIGSSIRSSVDENRPHSVPDVVVGNANDEAASSCERPRLGLRGTLHRLTVKLFSRGGRASGVGGEMGVDAWVGVGEDVGESVGSMLDIIWWPATE